MTHVEGMRWLLAEIESHPAADIRNYFPQTMRIFQYLSKAEKNEIAQEFYEWGTAHATEEPLKFAYSEFLLGATRHLSDDHEGALQMFTKARRHFEELDHSDGLGLCAVLTGSVYRTLGNFDLALKTLWEGYSLLKQSGIYLTSLAACTNSMANINLDLHNYEEALSWFNITYDESKKIDDYYFMIYALHGLGKVHAHQNQFDKAKSHFEKALQLAEQHNNPLAIGNSLTELANFNFKTGNYPKAEELNQRALLIREEHHHTGAAVTNYIHLGQVFMKQFKWDEAIQVLNNGLKMAEQIKVKPKRYQIHLLLSEIYQHLQMPKESLKHYKIFHELREQVEHEDNVRKLSDARLIFEAEQTKKENIIIKKQKEEIQKKNIELQQTIDELTLARVSKKAKALTLVIAIGLFIAEDAVLHLALTNLPSNNYFISLGVKMGIIFSLNPINKAIEKYLLKKVIRNKKQEQAAGSVDAGATAI